MCKIIFIREKNNILTSKNPEFLNIQKFGMIRIFAGVVDSS